MSQKISFTRNMIATGLLFFLAVAFISCEKYTWEKPVIKPSTDTVFFQTDILPIFSSCIGCHYGSKDFDARPDKAYISLIGKNLVSTSAPASSKLITFPFDLTKHPSVMSDKEKQKILDWITQGALNN